MITDRVLGQPIRPLFKVGVAVLPVALLGLLVARFLPSQHFGLVWPVCFVFVGACVVLFTPYLILAGVCFYSMSQLPFPKTTAFAAWYPHALLMLAIVFCLWRTWSLWPKDMIRQKDLSAGASKAPWWGYVLGGLAAIGFFALMGYVFHFQE